MRRIKTSNLPSLPFTDTTDMIPIASTSKLTYDDYCLLPDDGKCHEFVDGIHYVSPA